MTRILIIGNGADDKYIGNCLRECRKCDTDLVFDFFNTNLEETSSFRSEVNQYVTVKRHRPNWIYNIPKVRGYFNKSVDRHINLTNRLLRRFCRGLSNDLENVRNSLLCVSILSRDPFQIQRYEFSLNLQKYSVQVLYKTKARGYEPRTFFPFISCYHVGWFRRRVAIRLKGFSANYEK